MSSAEVRHDLRILEEAAQHERDLQDMGDTETALGQLRQALKKAEKLRDDAQKAFELAERAASTAEGKSRIRNQITAKLRDLHQAHPSLFPTGDTNGTIKSDVKE